MSVTAAVTASRAPGAPHIGRSGTRRPRTSATRRAAVRGLLREYHRHGDLGARSRLIQQYLPLVRRLARRHVGHGEQFEDLVQVGSIGLIKAIDRFQLERGVDLATYAIPTIDGEIKRHLRDRAWPIRIPRRSRSWIRRCELESPSSSTARTASSTATARSSAATSSARTGSHSPAASTSSTPASACCSGSRTSRG